MKTWLKVTLWIIGIIFILGVLNGIFNPSEKTYETGQIISEEKAENQGTSVVNEKTTEPLAILEHNMNYGDYGNLIVSGIAENTGNKRLSYAEIDVKFYDKEGILIDTSFDNINDLDSGEKWKFEVMYFGLDTYEVDSYAISVGTTW